MAEVTVDTLDNEVEVNVEAARTLKGDDGVSPVLSVTDITGGHRVTMVDAEGTHTFDVMDGEPGEPGDPGADGFSPVVSVTEITGGHQVAVTDKNGTTTFNVMDGQNAPDLDAGDIAYDGTETYPADTVGSEISSVKSAIQSKAAEPTGTKAAGKVYGLDSSLNPVWLTQSGGGGDDCAPVIVDSASGAIASFPDGLPRPVVGLSVGVEPVQDLHGYSNPWPGGGGKNLFNADAGSNGYIDNSGAVVSRSYQFASDYIAVTAGSSYTISAASQMANIGIAYFDSSKAIILPRVDNNSRQTLTITPATGVAYVRFWFYKDNSTDLTPTNVKETYKVQFEAGSSATSYSPYSNICPISGWTGTDVWVEPTHDTTAQPTLSISWQTEAGTVYGGNLDVLTGKLTVTAEFITLDGVTNKFTGVFGNTSVGTALYFTTIGNRQRFNASSGGVFSNVLIYSALGYTAQPLYSFPGASGSSATCTMILPSGTTVADGNAWLQSMVAAGTPVIVRRQLTTPLTYDLTPAQFDTLLGQNNIWATTGDVSVDYRADTKLYINKAIAAAVAAL